MSDIRLMEVILTLEQGGAQQLLVDKLLYLKAQGYYVCVCSFEDGSVRQVLEKHQIEVVLIPPKRFSVALFPLFLADLFRIYVTLKHLIEKHQINILQTHLLSIYDFITPFLRRNAPSLKGLIWTFHNTKLEFQEYDKWSLKLPIYKVLYSSLARYCDFLVAVSDSVDLFLRKDVGISANKIVNIHNALPLVDFQVEGNRSAFCQSLNIPLDGIVLLSIGRLSPQKGYPYLLKTVQILRSQQQTVFLCIVGEGSELEALQIYAKQQKISAHIRFLGHRSDIPFLLASADIFVLASLWEGMPRVILEAMASKIPIVTTNIGGIRQILTDKQNSCLVPPQNGKYLAEAIQRLLIHPDQAQLYAARAYEAVQDYDISQMGQTYITHYTEILAQATPNLGVEA